MFYEANHHQIQKEETTFIENKRGREAERLSREAGLPEDSDRELSPPPPPEGKTRKSKRIVEKIQKGITYDKYKHLHSPILSPGRRRNNGKKGAKTNENATRVRCVREEFSYIWCFESPHAYSHERETVRMPCLREEISSI